MTRSLPKLPSARSIGRAGWKIYRAGMFFFFRRLEEDNKFCQAISTHTDNNTFLVEKILLFLITFIIGQVIFFGWPNNYLKDISYDYWLLLPLYWASVRFGLKVVSFLLIGLTIQCLLGASSGLGIFAQDFLNTGLQAFWIFMLILSIISYSLSIWAKKYQTNKNKLKIAIAAAKLDILEWDIINNKISYGYISSNTDASFQSNIITFQEWQNKIHPDDRCHVLKELNNLLNSGSDLTIDYRFLNTSNSFKNIRSFLKATSGSNNSTKHIIGANFDITEQKTTEFNLMQTALSLQILIDEIPVSLLVADDNGNIRFLNKAFLGIIGYTYNEIPALDNWWSLACPDPYYRQFVLEKCQRYLESVAHTKKSNSLEVNICCRNGVSRVFIVNFVDINYTKEKCSLMILQDITELKKLYNMVKQSEEKFSTIFRNSPIGMAISRVFDDQFIEVNDALINAFGYSSDELIHHDAIKLDLWEAPEEYNKLMNKFIEQGFLRNEEIKFKSKPGKKGIMLHSRDIFLVNDDCFFLNTFIDITKDKDILSRLQKSEFFQEYANNLQAAIEQERTNIARDIHDELGGKLTAVKFAIAQIDSQESIIKSISNDLDSAISTIKRISSELRPSILDTMGLRDALDWLIDDFEARTKIHCIKALPDDIPIQDKLRITATFRIIQECLTNILKHSCATEMFLFAELEHEAVIIKIEDNGIGIPNEDLRNSNSNSNSNSLGILGIRERVNYLGGSVVFSNLVNHCGLSILIRIPLLASDLSTD